MLKILLKACRCKVRKDMPVFDLNRRVILQMHQQQMEDTDPLIDVQRFGNLAARALARLTQHLAGMFASASSNLVGDVLHFQYV